MNVSLTGKLEKYIASKVASGDYSTASEVVREALRALQADERARKAAHRLLRKEIKEAAEQLDRGEWVSGEQVIRELRQAQRRRRRKSA